MFEELERRLPKLGTQLVDAIPRMPERVCLWLLISVAVERAVAVEFMGIAAADIEARVEDARRRVATEVLGKGAPALRLPRSRRVAMTWVDAAARRRARLESGETAAERGGTFAEGDRRTVSAMAPSPEDAVLRSLVAENVDRAVIARFLDIAEEAVTERFPVQDDEWVFPWLLPRVPAWTAVTATLFAGAAAVFVGRDYLPAPIREWVVQAPEEGVSDRPEEPEGGVEEGLTAGAGTEEEATAEERAFWEAIAETGDIAAFETYLRRFPAGVYEEVAELRLDELRAAAASEAGR